MHLSAPFWFCLHDSENIVSWDIMYQTESWHQGVVKLLMHLCFDFNFDLNMFSWGLPADPVNPTKCGIQQWSETCNDEHTHTHIPLSNSYHTHKQTLAFYLNPDIPRVTRSLFFTNAVCVWECVMSAHQDTLLLTDWLKAFLLCCMSRTESQHTRCPLVIQRKAEAKVHQRPAHNCQHETNCLCD